MKAYPINEIFYSIQGEGVLAGFPAVFVRFAGCNLSCKWCDTDHTKKQEMTKEEILVEVKRLGRNAPYVVLTGGEPTLSIDRDLVDYLSRHYELCLETNGTMPIPLEARFATITVSPKYGGRLAVTSCTELKVVLDGKGDPESWKRLVSAVVYSIQPLSGDFAPAVKYVLEHPEWRLSLQQHKIIGVK